MTWIDTAQSIAIVVLAIGITAIATYATRRK